MWIIAISKECVNKDRNTHCIYIYIHKLYFNASKNCIRGGKSCKLSAILRDLEVDMFFAYYNLVDICTI